MNALELPSISSHLRDKTLFITLTYISRYMTQLFEKTDGYVLDFLYSVSGPPGTYGDSAPLDVAPQQIRGIHIIVFYDWLDDWALDSRPMSFLGYRTAFYVPILLIARQGMR